MSKVCVLVSGGLDSIAMLYEFSKKFDQIYPVYIKSGLYWEKSEIYWLKKYLKNLNNNKFKRLKILTSPVSDLYNGHWSITGVNIPDENSMDEEVYLPGRNILLLSKCSIFCQINDINNIGIGILKNNPFKDSTEKYFNIIEKLFSIGLKNIKILRPFSKVTKDQIILKYRNLPLELTFSCINPNNNYHCGKCNKCNERKKNFKIANIKDKTIYTK